MASGFYAAHPLLNGALMRINKEKHLSLSQMPGELFHGFILTLLLFHVFIFCHTDTLLFLWMRPKGHFMTIVLNVFYG